MHDVRRDHYEVLGVPRTASADDVQRAFRASARDLHPDVNPRPDAAARFHELSTAYAVLRDPVQRGRYDRSRVTVRRGGSSRVRPASAFASRPASRDVPRFLDEQPRVQVSLVIRVANPFRWRRLRFSRG